MKTCTKCGETKAVNQFSNDRTRPDGRFPHCLTCRAAYRRANYDTEKNREMCAKFYKTNRGVIREQQAEYRKANTERRREANKAYYHANTEKYISRGRESRARKRGATVEHVALSVLVARDRNLCGICGGLVAEADRSIDHILPLIAGGAHSYANTQLSHLRCNLSRQHRGTAQLRMIG